MERKGVCSSRHWQVMGLFCVSILKLASAQLRYSLLEESEPGTLVGNVAKDLGLNTAGISERALRLGSEQSQQYFALNLESGEIIVRSRIDREKLCGTNVNCILPVEIVLEKPLELYRLEIEILDTNDNSPVFQNAERTIKITELAAVGTRFPLERAQDPDLGINSVSTYKLSQSKYFSLNVQTRKNERPSPVLVLEKALDREEQGEHRLVLTAFDGSSAPRSGTCLITIIVIDQNDNAPVFDNAFYKISLKENAQLNTLVIRLNATDKDEGPNGEIRYTFEDISSDDITNVFSLDSKTGDIRLKGQLDYEKHHSYEISVKALDHGMPEMEGHCVIQVDIEDVNDNAPEILISSLVSSIPEDTPPGTTVGLLRVSDQDSGKNGEVQLEISTDLPFTITSTQNHYSFVTHGFLDREQASQYTIILQATDFGDPQLKTQTAINITVTDVNDNPPSFERSVVNVDIKENNKPGALLCTVSASDKDFGENAQITFSIINSLINGSPAMSFIYMDTQNGNIYAQQSFDYEQAQVLQFTIRAEDSGTPKLSSNSTVYLHILDENDNHPSILYPGNSRHLPAQQPIPRSLPAGSLITKVVAVDADSGYNAWLNYNIAKATDLTLFKVAPHTGEVRLARGFQETDSLLQNLCIVVKDNGTPALSSTATLVISLEDGSSKESRYSADLPSGAKQTPNITMYLIISLVAISVVSFVTLIILLTKCLRSKRQMTNSEMNNYIGHTQKTLQLNPNSTLRYMEVSMMPGSLQKQYSKAGGTSDINRDTLNMMKSLNFPQLKQLVNESDDVISGQFEWRDTAQENAQLTLQCKPCTYLRHGLGSYTFTCGFSRTYHTRDDIEIMGLQISTTVWKWQVIILFFSSGSSKNLQYSVLEEAEVGTLVGNITYDLGLPTAIMSERRVQLKSSGGGQYFAVDQHNGTFFVNRTIDRESMCGSTLQCLVTVEVVLEKPLELHRVEVEILDINDNSPMFSSSVQMIKITEIFAYPGARFPLEEAQDRDSGINGVRQYSLSANMYFSLSTRSLNDGARSPELVIEKVLDREERGDYQLILTAFDGGDPPKSGAAQIMIIILDFNDNAPMFQQTFYRINVTENLPPDTPIIQLNASDLDEGVNAEIEYFLDGRTPVSVRQLFSLDPDTGIITTNAILDFETSNFYEITVRAKDKGIPQMEGSCIVQIAIEDVNDHVPQILLTSLLGEIPEDTVVGTTIGLFSIIDMDSGKNGEVQLSLSPDGPFKIKSFKDHYALIVSNPLDREDVSLYEVVLTAGDLGFPPLSSKVTITVNISDVNDNPPMFLNEDFNTFILENNEPGHSLYTLSAFDRDEGTNAKFTYSIVEYQVGNVTVSSFIAINTISGVIYATSSFDYEQVNVLEIIAQVEDDGDPKLSTNMTLYIFILDMNDNPPKLLYPKFSRELNISKTVPVGYLVTKVSALDSDSGQNALLSYSFVEPVNDFPFNISSYSGEIKTVRNFLPTDESQQKLVLSISDKGYPSLSITVTLLVALMNNADSSRTSFSLLYSGNSTDILMYLVISLVAITLAFLVTLMLLVVKCFKRDLHLCQYPCWFLNPSNQDSCHGIQQPTLYFNMDGTLKYMEVRTDSANPEGHCYRTYFSQGAENINLTLLKPFTIPTMGELFDKTTDVNTMRDASQQGQPNTDWRFTQAQRPGPSGAQQPTEEAGVWPNNQFETERLQAMILASANEAAEGSSAVGPGAGTMGLSARYGPQFTLQHVPDYRQNIYIPGTTSTLTNAAGKRDGKAGAPSGNKKKSGKKEKK